MTQQRQAHISRDDLLLFDIDGVLVDVRPSYHEVIILTIPAYLEHVLGLPAPEDLIGQEHVAAIKRMGGFNNDWNSVAAILYTLVAQLPAVPPPEEASPQAVRRAARPLASLPDLDARLRAGARRILEMEATVRERGGGLDAVRALVGGRNAALVLYGPWDPATNLVFRIYQELYLGPDLFREVYGTPAWFHHAAGLIDAEERIISLSVLDTLAARGPLGLVTGRPRMEAEYALKRLGLWDYFHVLISHDEVVEEMKRRGTEEFLGKPHPWPLAEAAHRLDPTGTRGLAFVGDTGDDMQAAVRLRDRRATLAVGCTYVHEDPQAGAEHLRSTGADVVLAHPDEILTLLAE